MSSLTHQRCFHHSLREAVARCPECRHFYCRECITEHDDRVICASCLRRLAGTETQNKSRAAWLWAVVPCALGLAVAFLFFYFIGEGLLLLPSNFHEGNLWTDNWLNTP
ncbi:MAG TPA: hypothetical protein VK530_07280 [Candidatus Acidoferrum sp.]|nr:hypothetical protein [Candidatus Acidoferrum sp.]